MAQYTHSGQPILEAADRLERLASQHHISEYSCLKYGPAGYPGRYVPLSVQSPETFKELRARQAEWSNAKAWWYSENSKTMSPIVLGPSGADTPSDGLTQQLSAAMDEQLPTEGNSVRSFSMAAHPIKTSLSHPINISAIIPPEILAIISSHLMFTSSGASASTQPTVFEVPSPFTLDRFIIAHSQAQSSAHSHRNSTLPPPFPVDAPLSPHLRTRSHVSEALQAAINSGIKSGANALSGDDTEPRTTFHSNGSSVSISISLKPLHRTTSESAPSNPETQPSVEPLDLPSEATSETGPPTNAELQAEAQLPTVDSAPAPQPTTAPSFFLGNLFLSSCPGKKVRLQGPVKGRSAVCRDLSTDLQRMKDLGVGCVVCCLDDTELEFLGAPWPEYQTATSKIGLDVLRLPTPEGLAPSLSPALLDEQLTTLIQRYTLRGIPVLVHCRGGVGRAGVISACWIIKLGLCGWLDSAFSPSTPTLDSNVTSPQTLLKQDALELVEKVIAVVRRRRSPKAVETFEQAQFLLDFIEHLRSLHID